MEARIIYGKNEFRIYLGATQFDAAEITLGDHHLYLRIPGAPSNYGETLTVRADDPEELWRFGHAVQDLAVRVKKANDAAQREREAAQKAWRERSALRRTLVITKRPLQSDSPPDAPPT